MDIYECQPKVTLGLLMVTLELLMVTLELLMVTLGLLDANPWASRGFGRWWSSPS